MTADESLFVQMVTGGAPFASAMPGVVSRLISANDTTPMDPLASSMLGMPDGSSYLAGAQLVQSRINAGMAPF